MAAPARVLLTVPPVAQMPLGPGRMASTCRGGVGQGGGLGL